MCFFTHFNKIEQAKAAKVVLRFLFSVIYLSEKDKDMITDEIIKETYIRSVINRDREIIYATQAAVVRANFRNGTGRLARFMSNMPFSVANNTYWFHVLPYLRFLDIKYRKQDMVRRRSLALYNRVIWGVLYNETLPDIRYGLTQDIRKNIRAALEDVERNEQYANRYQ